MHNASAALTSFYSDKPWFDYVPFNVKIQSDKINTIYNNSKTLSICWDVKNQYISESRFKALNLKLLILYF